MARKPAVLYVMGCNCCPLRVSYRKVPYYRCDHPDVERESEQDLGRPIPPLHVFPGTDSPKWCPMKTTPVILKWPTGDN
jgi:hypothetical protein